MKGNVLISTRMTNQPGPLGTMNLIIRGCKTDCRNLCGCRRQDLVCDVACKHC